MKCIERFENLYDNLSQTQKKKLTKIINEEIQKALAQASIILSEEEKEKIKDKTGIKRIYACCSIVSSKQQEVFIDMLCSAIATAIGKCRLYLSDKTYVIDADNIPKIPNLFQLYRDQTIQTCTMRGDFSKFNFRDICLYETVFEESSILPEDRNFFDSLRNHKIACCELPPFNLDDYNLCTEPFIFDRIKFHPATKLGDFNKLRGDEVKFEYCIMPKLDLSNFTEINEMTDFLKGVTFHEETIFPDDVDFFVKMTTVERSRNLLYKCVFPSQDYTKYNFDGADIRNVSFCKDAKLPVKSDFFQKLNHDENGHASILGTFLPEMDLSDCDFCEVYIGGAKFPTHSKIPMKKNLFQEICGKDIRNTRLPEGDYSEYDFTDVLIDGAIFAGDSILPHNLFEQIKTPKNFWANRWPIQFVSDVLLHKLPGVPINLSSHKIPQDLLKMLYAKYKNNSAIYLPFLEK